MNLEQIRADIFRLFDIKVDKDDPIWAFLYANREVIRNLEDILELSKSENREYHKQMRIELEEFKRVAKESVRESIEQFDFRVEEFTRDMERLDKVHGELVQYHNRFKNDTTKAFDDQLDKLADLLDSNLMALEQRITHIVEAVNYDKFRQNIEREVDAVIKKSLTEVRAGVAINNKAMDRVRELQDQHEQVTRELKSRVSMLTVLSVAQTVLFGASLIFLAMIFFSNSSFDLFGNDSSSSSSIERGLK